MLKLDQIASHNQRYWNKIVARGSQYTRPWLDLKVETLRAFADGKIEVLPEPYRYIYPRCVFANVAGKDVLCLASAGGQQSAVFGLLGARVIVLDLTQRQLEGDRQAAEHHGYAITTVQGDMRDLSAFAGASFDLVYQAISICYVPDVRQVYRQAARVLRPRGLYRVGHCNPASQLVEESSWDGQGYRLLSPYVGGPVEVQEEEEDGLEFRHLLSDVFNGLIEAGFAIQGVWEDPRHLQHDPQARPGSYEHMLTFTQVYFAIVAERSA